ncbi:hypothetical protein Tco_1547450 [Tanacetum coccineum]
MRRVFGVKKDKEPPPSLNDASDRNIMHFGQDGLLILPEQQCMKQPASSRPLMLQSQRSEILGYQMSLESLEVMLKTHEKNEYAWDDKAIQKRTKRARRLMLLFDSGCSGSMTGDKDKLSDFKDYKG